MSYVKRAKKRKHKSTLFCVLDFMKQENDNKGNLAVRKRQNTELLKNVTVVDKVTSHFHVVFDKADFLLRYLLAGGGFENVL